MRGLHRRRVLAATGTGIATGIAGCIGGPTSADRGTTETLSTPAYDCANASRPELTMPDDEDWSVEPAEYPERPGSLSDAAAVRTYVEDYERAYKRNEWLEQLEAELVGFGMDVERTWNHDSAAGTAIARLKYTFWFTDEEEDGSLAAGHSEVIYASYYVDDAVVLRAADAGRREDVVARDPDPLETGEPVECFD